MKVKECKNMYKICVADYLFSILKNLDKIDAILEKNYNQTITYIPKHKKCLKIDFNTD